MLSFPPRITQVVNPAVRPALAALLAVGLAAQPALSASVDITGGNTVAGINNAVSGVGNVVDNDSDRNSVSGLFNNVL
ncbi:MAG: hypothetical protein E2O66_05305, partial [Deltaproteobacteria bacterium]